MATETNRNQSSQVDQDPPVLASARALLGRVFVGHGVSALITEVEAYNGPDDPASHAFKRTARSEIMYGPPNRLYVYQIHTHHCANIVTSPEGRGSAVLIRAGAIVDGLALAHDRRGDVADHLLARGPGNLTRALGITKADLHTDLLDAKGVHLLPASETIAAERIRSGPRVGVRLAADRPWRFWLDGEPSVSAYRRHPKA
ncbi:DNA-3-methyladenine glycosylase [Gordonia neofelifaecis]|uniref:Putative 3-methyladenine DNA glycosylase n=1 Tax=Gordonia neofelifaecis NRRL B-59395 TaxID=644548 RepID=F1YKI7_9ACTN|nr:DNA-3-methyladenine glycosylase [Gordonia neofelifaecis]EGD54631.1 DNA-3-methyladenine glycosylase [Gordonia neofelifaecis NRRL B-59395]